MCRLIVLAVTRSIIVVGPEGGQVAVLPLFLPKRDPKSQTQNTISSTRPLSQPGPHGPGLSQRPSQPRVKTDGMYSSKAQVDR